MELKYGTNCRTNVLGNINPNQVHSLILKFRHLFWHTDHNKKQPKQLIGCADEGNKLLVFIVSDFLFETFIITLNI
jgi:hypothetical protein